MDCYKKKTVSNFETVFFCYDNIRFSLDFNDLSNTATAFFINIILKLDNATLNYIIKNSVIKESKFLCYPEY